MSSNTLLIYNASSEELAAIANQLTESRTSNQLAQAVHLKSFARVLAIFATATAATHEMSRLKHQYPDATVVFGEYTNLHAQPKYLALPDAGTLWFTSPPLSPEETWEQTMEEEPNKQSHFDADFTRTLAAALQKVRDHAAVMHDPETTHSCTIYQSPTESLPNIRIDWENCEAPSLSSHKEYPHTAMPAMDQID